MELYIIRHAESGNNALAGVFDYDDYIAKRSPDPPITEIGIEQASLLAAHLADRQHPESNDKLPTANGGQGYGISHLYCSAMLRAMQTAQPIADRLGLRPSVWVDIHEHGGIFQGDPRKGSVSHHRGMSRSRILETFAEYALPDEVTEDGWWPGGYEEFEGCEERAERVAGILRRWADERPDDRIAMVSHGTFIDRLLKSLLGKQASRDLHFFHYNTAVTRLDFLTNGPLVLRYTNRTQHLQPALTTR